MVASHPLGEWVSIGPDGIVGSIYDPPDSGRATVIAVNPLNKSDVWLGTATGGVWHSSNINDIDYQWENMTDLAPWLSIGSLLLENCNNERCNTVWIGTGENNIRRDTYYGKGLYKLIWNESEGEYVLGLVGNSDELFMYGSIIDIVRVGQTIYIAVSKGKSASGSTTIVTAPTPEAEYGVHRSNDEGQTWTKVGENPGNSLPSDMEVQGTTLLVGFHGEGIFRLAVGDVWCPFGPTQTTVSSCPNVSNVLPNPATVEFDHVETAVSPADQDVIYAAYGRCPSETYVGGENPLFFNSIDGGTTWHAAENTEYIRTYSRYTHMLECHPTDVNKIYYGGLELWFSNDYGNGFVKLDANIHLDIQTMCFPDNSDPLFQYIASDGGFYKKYHPNSGMYVVDPLNQGLQTVQFYSISSSSWEGPTEVLAGTQDNGTLFFTGSPLWQFVLDGDGGDCMIARDDLYYASLYDVSPRRALSLTPSLATFVVFATGIDSSDPYLFFPPFIMHPQTLELYFGTNRLYWRASDGATWEAISPEFDISPDILPEIERRNAISAVAVSRSNPQVVYLSLHNGDV